MASLLGWLGNGLKDIEHAIGAGVGGVVHGVENAVGVGQPQPQQTPPNFQQPTQPNPQQAQLSAPDVASAILSSITHNNPQPAKPPVLTPGKPVAAPSLIDSLNHATGIRPPAFGAPATPVAPVAAPPAPQGNILTKTVGNTGHIINDVLNPTQGAKDAIAAAQHTNIPGGIFTPAGQPETVLQAAEKIPGAAWGMTPILPQVVSDVKENYDNGHSIKDAAASIIPSAMVHTAEFGKGILEGPSKVGLGLESEFNKDVRHIPNATSSLPENSPYTQFIHWLNDKTGINLDPGEVNSISSQVQDQGLIPAATNNLFEVAGPLFAAKYAENKGIVKSPDMEDIYNHPAVQQALGGVRDAVNQAHDAYQNSVLGSQAGHIKVPGLSDEANANLNEAARNASSAAEFSKAVQGADLPTDFSSPDFYNKVQAEMQLEDQLREANPNLKVSAESSPTDKLTALQSALQQSGKQFQDTGEKMFGSRKDMAKYSNLSADGLTELEEQNPRVAEKMTTKPRVLGEEAKYKVDTSGDPGLENYKKLVVDNIPNKPANSPMARKAYVEEMPQLLQAVKNADNMQELREALADFAGRNSMARRSEVKGTYGAKLYNVLMGQSTAARMALYRPPTDFSFLEKPESAATPTAPRSTESLHGGELVPYSRTGEAPSLAKMSPQELRDQYGMKGLEYGNYVKDAEAADHLQRYGEALHDMERVLNVNLGDLFRKMNLGTAFGARGKGKALAHYESDTKVINITKKTGSDGTLAHEFAHALDDYLGNGKAGRDNFATDGKSPDPKIAEAVKQVMSTIKQGESVRTWNFNPDKPSRYRFPLVDQLIANGMKDPSEIMAKVRESYPGTSLSKLHDVAQYAATKTGIHDVTVKVKGSAFLNAALQQGDYWSRPTEMFARAFSAYVHAKEQTAGIVNNYLAHTDEHRLNSTLFTPDNMHEVIPAMDHLLDVIKQEKGIGGAPKRPLANVSKKTEIANVDQPNVNKIEVPEHNSSLGDREHLVLSKYGPELYHETNSAGAADILKQIGSGYPQDITVANAPELAVGQGGKGVKIVFKSGKVAGKFSNQLKPGAGYLHDQGKTDELHITRADERGAVKSVEIPKDQYNQFPITGVTASDLTSVGLNPRAFKELPNGNLLFDEPLKAEKAPEKPAAEGTKTPAKAEKASVAQSTTKEPGSLADIGEQLGRLRAQIKKSDSPTSDMIETEKELAQQYSKLKEQAKEAGAPTKPVPAVDMEAAKNAQEVVDTLSKELADQMRSTDKEGTVSTIKTDNGYKRASSNSKFYSDYYKANKKPPTQAAYLEEAHRMLRAGSDDNATLYQDALKTLDKHFKDVSDYADAFGISKEAAEKELKQMAEAKKNPGADEVKKNAAASKTSEKLTNMAEQEKAKNIRTPEENTEANPTKRELPKVNDGDYEKARSNVQYVQNDIQNHAIQVIHSLKALSKSEKKIFWDVVEKTQDYHSPAMDTAVARWHALSDTVHAWSQSLGGNTNYIAHYARHNWDLSDPEQMAKFKALVEERYPEAFKGLDNMPRVFKTLQEGRAAGFELKHPTDPTEDIIDYANKSQWQLGRQTLVKSFDEADRGERETTTKPARAFDLGTGDYIKLSTKGLKEARTFTSAPENGHLLKAYDTINRELKAKLLSLSAFHVNNVGEQMTAALAGLPKDYFTGEAHPLQAAKLIPGAYRAIVDGHYADMTLQKALDDGTLRDLARIGYPVREGSDYASSGKLSLKGNWGEGATFDRALPVMQVINGRALLEDMSKRGIDLDSVEARRIGKTAYEISGFMNRTLRNFDPRTQRLISRFLLAPQFTLSKWSVLYTAATDFGMAGNLARRAVVGKYLADVLIAGVAGELNGQQSDSIKDLFVRELVHPSIPTPWQDSKGNNIELGLPSNYTSEALGLVGSLGRNSDGDTTVNFHPGNIPGNVANYGRSRLAMVPGMGLKLATNENYAGRPLYDPNASTKTKAEQAATTLGMGTLPIGLQGVPQIDAIKSHLPQDIQDVLNAQANSGTNPLLKSFGSSMGVTPRTDHTTGQGLQSTQYFAAGDEAKGQASNTAVKDALDAWLGSKKNPVTGQYNQLPTADDARAKATALLRTVGSTTDGKPDGIDLLMGMNQKLSDQGQKVDPLWVDPTTGQARDKKQIIAYLQYQAMPPKGPDQTDWINKNPWYAKGPQNMRQQRQDFFDSLPPADPNKPNSPIEFPTPDVSTQSLMDSYFNTTDSKVRAQMLQEHPELQDQFDKQDSYYNQLRQAQGYAANKTYPNATPQLQKFINTYLAADKAGRKSLRSTNLGQYQQMSAYFDSADLYSLGKQAAVSALQGEPDTTTKELQNINYLAQDIYQNPDGTYNLTPAGWTMGLAKAGSGGGYSKKKSSSSRVSFSAAGHAGRTAKLLKGAGGKFHTSGSKVKTAKVGSTRKLAKGLSLPKVPTVKPPRQGVA